MTIRLSLLLLLLLLTGCVDRPFASYGDRHVTYSSPVVNNAKQCDMSGNIINRDNRDCVGKVAAADRNSPTITVMKPGVAVPLDVVDAAALEPPQH